MNDRDVSKTNAVLAAALLIAFLIWGLKIFLWTALILLIGAAAGSRANSLIAVSWLKLSKMIGEVNSRILLTLVFYFVLTPVAFLFRLFNKSLVDHFKHNREKSMFSDCTDKYSRQYFLNQW